MAKNKIEHLADYICEKCYKAIKEKDDYFIVITNLKGKEVKRVYMHKKCNDAINQINQNAMKMISNLGNMIPNIFGNSRKEQEVKLDL